jgi:hypothetical protein
MMLAVEWVTPRQVAKLVEESIGEKVKVTEIDDAKWPSLKEGNEEIWLNNEWYYTHKDARDLELTNKLLPNATRVKDHIRSLGKNIVQ